jgi:flagellar hook assembly protein FlgD
LVRAFPNPVSTTTRLHYAVPAGYSGPVEIAILDVQGRALRTLVNKGQNPGNYYVTWEGLDQAGSALPNGVYFARMTAGRHRAGVKLVLQR